MTRLDEAMRGWAAARERAGHPFPRMVPVVPYAQTRPEAEYAVAAQALWWTECGWPERGVWN